MDANELTPPYRWSLAEAVLKAQDRVPAPGAVTKKKTLLNEAVRADPAIGAAAPTMSGYCAAHLIGPGCPLRRHWQCHRDGRGARREGHGDGVARPAGGGHHGGHLSLPVDANSATGVGRMQRSSRAFESSKYGFCNLLRGGESRVAFESLFKR